MRYYLPPTHIAELPSVRMQRSEACDFYSGTKPDLVAAGLLPAHLFPGEPGVGRTAVCYRPYGVTSWSGDTPGVMQVRKTASGRFHIWLTVSHAERRRRREERERAERAGWAAALDLVRTAIAATASEQDPRSDSLPGPRAEGDPRARLRLAWSKPAR